MPGQCWSIKKMLKEKQKKEEGIVEKDRSGGEPVLVLPQLAKVETKAYTPGWQRCYLGCIEF